MFLYKHFYIISQQLMTLECTAHILYAVNAVAFAKPATVMVKGRWRCKHEPFKFSISHHLSSCHHSSRSSVCISFMCVQYVAALHSLCLYFEQSVHHRPTPSGTDLFFIIHTSSTFSCFFPSLLLSRSECVCVCACVCESEFHLIQFYLNTNVLMF